MAETKHKNVKKLSSAVLELKFMKRTKEKVIQAEKENPDLYSDQLSELNSINNVVLLGSHYDVMTYLPCRLSFGGMEPNIEKLNAEKLTGLYEIIPKEEIKEEEEEGVDVTREEMAEHFTSMNETLGKKFNKNKRKSNELPKNMKKRKLFTQLMRESTQIKGERNEEMAEQFTSMKETRGRKFNINKGKSNENSRTRKKRKLFGHGQSKGIGKQLKGEGKQSEGESKQLKEGKKICKPEESK